MIALLFALALAADPVPSEVARAIAELGDDDYRIRERATRHLWTLGPAAEAGLRDAIKSDDPEVVARAGRVLDFVAVGLRHDDPRKLIALVVNLRQEPEAWPNVVAELADFGPHGLDVAKKLAERLPGGTERATERRRQLDAQAHRVAFAPVAAGRDDEAEAFLEGIARTGDEPARHYAAFLAARGRLDARWPTWQARFAANDAPDANEVARVVFALARLRGDAAMALAAAERINDPESVECAKYDSAAWGELIDLEVKTHSKGVAITRDTQLGVRAYIARLAGDEAAEEAAIKELTAFASAATTYPIAPRAFRALMANRRLKEAELRLTAFDMTPVRFELCAQTHRDAEALALVPRAMKSGTAAYWGMVNARLRFYQTRGDSYAIDAIVLANVPDTTAVAEHATLLEVVEQLVSTGRDEAGRRLAAAALAGAAKPTEVFEKALPKTPLAAEAWWTIVRRQWANEPAAAAMARLPALCDARLKEPDGRAQLAVAEVVARAMPRDTERLLAGLGEACQSAGIDDEATRLYGAAGATGAIKLGDLFAERDRWADAADAYERAVKADVKQPLPLWLAGWARARTGRADGTEWMSRAHALPLGDEDSRVKFADELMKRAWLGPEPGEAARRERRMVLRLALPSSSPGRTVAGQLSADPLAFADKRAAATATDLFLLRMIRSIAYFRSPSSYLYMLHRLDVQRVAADIAAGDLDAARKSAASAEQWLPAQPSPAVLLVPALAKANRVADADALYGATASALDKLAATYPRSATFRTQRAWLAARCQRDLDVGLASAKQAVEFAPNDVAAREALAEVLFQRGDKDEALAAAKRCVELAPKSGYFVRYAARIETGDREAALPDGVLR